MIRRRTRWRVIQHLPVLYRQHRARGLSMCVALDCCWVVFLYGVIRRHA
jgi:hypothetical protein